MPKVFPSQHIIPSLHRTTAAFPWWCDFCYRRNCLKGRVTKGRQDTANPDPPASNVLADTSSAGTLLITPEIGFNEFFSCWHWLWSAHHLDEAVNTPLFLPSQCLLPKYELLVLSGMASAAVNPLLVLSPAKTSCDAQRTRCCGQAASSTWWYRAMAGPAVVFTQLAYYQVNLAASHAAGLVWSKRIGDLSVLYFLGSR